MIGKTLFNSNLSTVTYNGVSHTLTARQTDILLLLSQNIGTMIEREQILKTVWGDDSNANSLALNVQITYLRRILEDDKSISIVSLKKKGYILQIRWENVLLQLYKPSIRDFSFTDYYLNNNGDCSIHRVVAFIFTYYKKISNLFADSKGSSIFSLYKLFNT